MKLSQLYDQIIRFGRDADPRGSRAARVDSYSDTALLYGNPDTEVSKIMVGIDIEVPELLLADKLRKKRGLDLVLAHHPEGRAWAALHRVMSLQADMLIKIGVSPSVARGMIADRVSEVERRLLPQNHMRSVDAARLLDIPFACVHTPADNHAFTYIKGLIEK
ncbi:MAG: NGG1p interacting factor NIF3, partial [Candidatus Omnitrophica bacterium]|nr:NGG1p interacting factor NIF3 [Candidatus Omnitrophota bacterium]